jgi:hypothetical protein
MAVVVFVGLLLGWAAHRERVRWQKYRLINQDIAVSGAEASYLNAGLAREAAEEGKRDVTHILSVMTPFPHLIQG